MMGSGYFRSGETGLDRPEFLLLTVLSHCSGTIKGRTKFMKLVFLSEYYDREQQELKPEEEIGVFNDFIIYNHGPFSRDVMDSFDILKEKDLIREETELTYSGDRRKIIKLTDKGEELIEELEQFGSVENTISEFCQDSGSELEEKSLSLLGISRKEKPKYRFRDVSDIIAC